MSVSPSTFMNCMGDDFVIVKKSKITIEPSSSRPTRTACTPGNDRGCALKNCDRRKYFPVDSLDGLENKYDSYFNRRLK